MWLGPGAILTVTTRDELIYLSYKGCNQIIIKIVSVLCRDVSVM